MDSCAQEREMRAARWREREDAYAFLATSFLRAMSSKSAAGINPEFWQSLTHDCPLGASNDRIAHALDELASTAKLLSSLDRDHAIERVDVEFTKLFVGPGTPAAPPWETLYRADTDVLFGDATFEMKHLLARSGVRATKASHQLEDHIGFELAYLSYNSACFAVEEPGVERIAREAAFIEEHPLSFVGRLHEKATAASVTGYYAPLIELAWGFLLADADELRRMASGDRSRIAVEGDSL